MIMLENSESFLDALELCFSECAGLEHQIHADLETYEPAGTIAFDAVLAFVDALPPQERSKAVSVAEVYLAQAPACRRREWASDRTFQVLGNTPAWTLINSLSLTRSVENEQQFSLGEVDIGHLRHIGILDSPLNPEYIRLLETSSIKALKSIEIYDDALDAAGVLTFAQSGILERLTEACGINESVLHTAQDLRLNSVNLKGTAASLRMLEHKCADSLQQLAIWAPDEHVDECIETLLHRGKLLAGLTSLTLRMNLTDSQFSRLVSSPCLGRLTHFQLHDFAGLSGITAEALDGLREASFLPCLEFLGIRNQDLGDRGWQVLGNLPFQRLSTLELQRTGGTSTGLASLAQAQWLANIDRLDISRNEVHSEGAAALAGSHFASKIRNLSLLGCKIGNEGALALSTSATLGNLRSALIDGIGGSGAERLISCGWFHSLESIVLGVYNDCSGVDLMSAFANSGTFPALRSLNIGDCITDIGLQTLATKVSLPRLRRLIMRLNDISGSGVAMLARMPIMPRLWELVLDSCPCGDEGAFALAEITDECQLVQLGLWNCGLSPAGARALASSKLTRSVRWLSIENMLRRVWMESPHINPLLKARLQEQS